MRILLASSEVQPYSKSGGLADMVGALAKAFAQAGHEVGVVTPFYGVVAKRYPDLMPFDWEFDLPLGPERVRAGVRTLEPAPGLTLYFVEHPAFYGRDGLYQGGGRDYPDNAQRFIYFSKCVAHLARYLAPGPDLVHVHDWQAGLVPLLIRHQQLSDGWRNPPGTCLTIHNLAYQGNFPAAAYGYTNLPLDYFNMRGVEFYGGMNCLKAGIVYSDLITTVSPRYAREITTVEYGCGLDGELRQRQQSLIGILNGVDYDDWNTTANPHLPHPFGSGSMAGKEKDKLELQREFGLPATATVPLFGSVTRLAEQKGVDIQLGALEEMLSANLQFVLLGSGDPAYEQAYIELARRFPAKVALQVGYNEGLAHRIVAGSDFYLMPSRFEPCGLTQLYSLRYGTVPIVRVTGGLDDTVVDPSADAETANGIKFGEYSVRALARAMRKALVLYDSPEVLHHFQTNAMAADFSWARTQERYLELFSRVVGDRAARSVT